MKKEGLLSIILPAFNEEKIIKKEEIWEKYIKN